MKPLRKIVILWNELLEEVKEWAKAIGIFLAFVVPGLAAAAGLAWCLGYIYVHWFHVDALKLLSNSKSANEAMFALGMGTIVGFFVGALLIIGLIIVPLEKLVKKWKELDAS